ncbi:MAG TPA: hypothetical protein VGP82_08755 [Ktedonobacterales bacterium]|nr:hypothetical protein [Ktedonobacterales bacterium]
MAPRAIPPAARARRKPTCGGAIRQRRAARGKQGSNRRTQAVRLLARVHQTIRRQRRDLHHKAALALALALVRRYDTV